MTIKKLIEDLSNADPDQEVFMGTRSEALGSGEGWSPYGFNVYIPLDKIPDLSKITKESE